MSATWWSEILSAMSLDALERRVWIVSRIRPFPSTQTSRLLFVTATQTIVCHRFPFKNLAFSKLRYQSLRLERYLSTISRICVQRSDSKGSLRSKIDKRDVFLRAGDVHRVETAGFTRGRGNGAAEIKQKNRHPRALARGVVRPRVRDERAIFSNYLVPRAGIANRIC